MFAKLIAFCLSISVIYYYLVSTASISSVSSKPAHGVSALQLSYAASYSRSNLPATVVISRLERPLLFASA